MRYVVSDRAKAFIPLAAKGLECLRMPDGFQGMHELGTSAGLALGRRLRQAQQERTQATEALARRPGPSPVDQPDLQAKGVVEARQVEVTRWAGVHRNSRHHLEGLSLTRHPCRLSDAVPQPAAQGARQRTAAVEAIAAFAQSHQLPVRHDIMKKGRPQVPARAALVDFWWEGVRQDVEQATIALPWRPWARESLLPWVYGEHQMAHTRCARRQATIRRAWGGRGAALRTRDHPAASCTGLGGLARVGHPAGPGIATRLLGGGRSQRRSGATPSQPARVPEAAGQGVDNPA